MQKGAIMTEHIESIVNEALSEHKASRLFLLQDQRCKMRLIRFRRMGWEISEPVPVQHEGNPAFKSIIKINGKSTDIYAHTIASARVCAVNTILLLMKNSSGDLSF